jgi:hypothetical protein
MPRKRLGHLYDIRYEWIFTLDSVPQCTVESQDWCDACRKEIEYRLHWATKRYKHFSANPQPEMPTWSGSWKEICDEYQTMLRNPKPSPFGHREGLAPDCVWIKELKKLMTFGYEKCDSYDIVEIAHVANWSVPTGLKAQIAGSHEGWHVTMGS